MSRKNGGNDIRLVSVEGENIRILKLAAVRLDGEPGLFRVTGPNEAGKTTFLDLVAMLFGGKKAVKSETIQEGKDGGFCRAELSNGYSIERRFTRAEPDGYLTVTTPDDAVPRAPQTLLDAWRGSHAFDPGALLAKRTRDIEDIILGLAKRKGLKEDLARIAADQERLRDERTPYNRVVQRVQRMDAPEGERPEPVDVSGEMARLRELRDAQAHRKDLAETWREKNESWVAACDAVTEHLEKIEQLRAALKEAEEALPEFEHIRDRLEAQRDKAEAAMEAAPDPSEEIEAVEARISEADAVSEALEPWKAWERAQKEAAEARAERDRLNAALADVDAEREELLRSAEIPVPGITFADDGAMLLDGHPLDVASGRRRLDMAYDIAKAANPRLKVLLLDEANDYDVPSLERLNERAREDGMQVLACRIGIEGPGEIVVTDGRAINQGAEVDDAAEEEAEVAR